MVNPYYLRREDEGLAGQLSAPVNALDFSIRHAGLLLRQELASHREEMHRQRSGIILPPFFPVIARP